MSGQSDFLLYAASPIGLVTALVTLIRLYGNTLMKKIIGRQFETKSEVLADVTSVSIADVSMEFHKDRTTLEQTIAPSPEHEALFGIYIRRSCKGDTLLPTLLSRAGLIRCFRDAIMSSERVGWYSINVIRTHGGNSITVSRDLTSVMVRCEDNLIQNMFIMTDYRCLDVPASTSEGYSELQSSEIVGFTYVDGPGVSPALTAGNCGSHTRQVHQKRLKYMASSVCIGLNIGIILMNGWIYREIVTSTLIAIGIAGSFLGSWKTASLIYDAVQVYTIPLEDSEVLRAGFFSNFDNTGINLNLPPQAIAISKSSPFQPTLRVVTSTVAISSLAFISLYLGLRAAAWWIPLLMLANVGLTSCMRAILSEELDLSEKGGWAWSFPRFRQCRGLCPHMFIHQETNSSYDQIGLRRLSTDLFTESNSDTKDEPGLKNEPVLEGREAAIEAYALKSVEGSKISCAQDMVPRSPSCWTVISIAGKIGPRLSSDTSHYEYDEELSLITNAFAVAFALQRKGLRPKVEPGRYIRSEFLAVGAIWQQDLEIYVPYSLAIADCTSRPFFAAGNLAGYLRVWATAALVGDHRITKTSKTFFAQPQEEELYTAPYHPCDPLLGPEIPGLDLEISRICQYTQTMASDPRARALSFHHGQIWSNRVMLWMAVKILFVLKASWPPDAQQKFGDDWKALNVEFNSCQKRKGSVEATAFCHYDAARNISEWCYAENVSWYVECLETAGLLEACR
ncbi:hypothetical protein MMC06_000151 [Schaereria dolodes]|nr:hypothetical protein [Schaereria dolodes]